MSSSLLTYTSARTSPRGGPFTMSWAATRSGSSTMASASCCSVPTSTSSAPRPRSTGPPRWWAVCGAHWGGPPEPETAVHGSGGTVSASIRRGWTRVRERPTRAAADRGTRLGGGESKRRRRPRLPAPPSRVTLLSRECGLRAAGGRVRRPARRRHGLGVARHHDGEQRARRGLPLPLEVQRAVIEHIRELERGPAEPARDRVDRPLQAGDRGLRAAEVVDDRDGAARAAHAPGFGHHAVRIRHHAHHVEGHHVVEAVVRELQVERIALLERDVPPGIAVH